MINNYKKFIFILALLTFSKDIFANTDPSSELIRQQERAAQSQKNNITKPDIRLPIVTQEKNIYKIPNHETPCFLITEITLNRLKQDGTLDKENKFNHYLDTANFTHNGENDSALNRCLGSQGINLIMKRIQNKIIADGFITTRVLAVPQDLTQKRLKLAIIPGVIRNINFKPHNPRATFWNALPSASGDYLNLRDIEQALENFKRLPSSEVDIKIHPSKAANPQVGESDLEILWQQKFPFRLNLSLDNAGSKYTGKNQVSGSFSYDHFLTLNDLLFISINRDIGGGIKGARGTKGNTAHYSIPYGYWLISLTANQNNYYQTVYGDSTSYEYSGKSQSSELQISHLFYRDAKRKSKWYLSHWLTSSKNFINDAEIEVQRRRMTGFELGINHLEYYKNSRLDLDVSYRWGINSANSLKAPEEKFREGTSTPKILKLRTFLATPINFSSHSLTYQVELQSQWNLTPLVPQDRFSIGSRYNVRGFDGESTLTGDKGWLIRNDFIFNIPNSQQNLYIGLDYGEVGGQSTRYLIQKQLSGTAIGMKGNFKKMTYDGYFSRALSSPENFSKQTTNFDFMLNWYF